MPWKRRQQPGLSVKQTFFILIACMLTGMLACWIGTGTGAFYGSASRKITSMVSGGVTPEMIQRYKASR